MLMTGSKGFLGSSDLDTGGDERQPSLQHSFQEEFLQSFYDDEEFRNQVLRCLLSKTEVHSFIPLRIERKPRRTWLKDLECTGLVFTKDNEAEEGSYCSDEKSVSTSEQQMYRDAACQFFERECSVYDRAQVGAVDAICQYPEPPEPGCSISPLGSIGIEDPGRELRFGENQRHVTNLFQPGKGKKQLSYHCRSPKEDPCCRRGPSSADAPRSETYTVRSVAAWLQSLFTDARNTTRRLEFSCIPRVPSLMLSSNPLATLDWEDKTGQFSGWQGHSPKNEGGPVLPPKPTMCAEQATPTQLIGKDQKVKSSERVKFSEREPRSIMRLWDSLLKKLFSMKVKIRFSHVNRGSIPGEGSSRSASDKLHNHSLCSPGRKVYQI